MDPEETGELRVPIAEEKLSVSRRQVATDRVRVRTATDTEDVLVEELLRVGRLDVSRVPADREVAEAPAPYRDGATLVIPVVEERLFVEKRLFVVEEVRVTESVRDETVAVPATLRRTRAVVERDPPETTGTPTATGSNR